MNTNTAYVCVHSQVDRCTFACPSVCNWEFVNKGIVDNSQSVTLATTYHTPYWHTPRLIKKWVGYTCCQQLWFGVDGLQSITSLKEPILNFMYQSWYMKFRVQNNPGCSLASPFFVLRFAFRKTTEVEKWRKNILHFIIKHSVTSQDPSCSWNWEYSVPPVRNCSQVYCTHICSRATLTCCSLPPLKWCDGAHPHPHPFLL